VDENSLAFAGLFFLFVISQRPGSPANVLAGVDRPTGAEKSASLPRS